MTYNYNIFMRQAQNLFLFYLFMYSNVFIYLLINDYDIINKKYIMYVK